MTTFKADYDAVNNLLVVDFGDTPATNDVIVKDAAQIISAIKFTGGPLLKITGRTSIIVAFAIAHHVNHLYGAIAYFDPKIPAYIVAVSHHPDYPLGGLISA